MSKPVTELAYLPLLPRSNINDPNTNEATILHDCINVVLAQPGAQRCYWGTEVESPTTLRFFLDWDSIDSHKAFEADETAYPAFVKNLLTIMDPQRGFKMYHAPFQPHPAKMALNAPVTEVLTMYLDADITAGDQEEIMRNLGKLVEVIEGIEGAGFHGEYAGWVVEEQEHENVKGKAKVLTMVMGWDSLEKHLDFTKTEVFKKNAHLLNRAKGLRHMEVYHVNFTNVQGGL